MPITLTSDIRQRSLFKVFSSLAFVALIAFGILQATFYGNNLLGSLEFFAGSILLLNLASFYFIKNIRLARTILILVVFLLLQELLITGGIQGTGIFWFFMFPVATFFLSGIDEGRWWVGATYVATAIVVLASDLGYVASLPYDDGVLGQFLAVYIVISALAYFYELSREQAQEETQNREELLNSLLDNLPAGVIVAHAPEGKIEIMNHIATNMLGRNRKGDLFADDTTGIYKIVHEDGTEYQIKDLPLTITLKTGKPSVESDIYIAHPDGSLIATRGSSVPVNDKNGVMRWVTVVLEDITHEHEIDRAKTEFVSLASHQLRTPLSAIGWYSEMLMAGDAGPMTDDQKNYLKEIHDGNTRMVDLVNSLLNVSRLELGTFAIEPQPTDVVAIVESVLAELAPQITEKKQHLEKKFASDIPLIPVDTKLFRMIIQNLASNAVKYTPAGGAIEIAVEKKDVDLAITVRDNGYGIPKNQQDKIFGKLFRADNIRKFETEGTGLGLYIVKSILDQSGGSVRFESEEGKGSTFFVKIPLSGMHGKEGARKLS